MSGSQEPANPNDMQETINRADAAADRALNQCLDLINKVCAESGLRTDGLVYVSAIVASQLMARNLFFAPTKEAMLKLKSDLEEQLGGVLENACRHLSEMENRSSQIIRPS